MFEDGEFEIDEEFLNSVFDAEKSAINNDASLDVTLGCQSEPLLAKRRKTSVSPISSSSPQEKLQTPALRTSEESAQLVALAARKSALAQKTPSDRKQWNVESQPKRKSLCGSENAPNSRTGRNISIAENEIFKQPLQRAGINSAGKQSVPHSPVQSNSCSETSFSLNTSRVRQRKFPGPAGLLPERGRSYVQGQRPNFSSLLIVSGNDLDEAEEPLSLCSQSSASVLEDGPWITLQSDLADVGQDLLQHYTVAWVKQKAAARQLVGQKVPFLAAVLHSIDCSSPDPCVVLRDATGEIPGTLHRSVWDSFGGQLIAGSALVLRFVGVLSTGISARRHYLNITSNNIVTIYSSPLCESSVLEPSNRVRKTDVHKWTLNQLIQGANSWEEQSKRKKDISAIPMSRNASPFSANVSSPANFSNQPVRPQLHTANRSDRSPSSVSSYSGRNTSSATFTVPNERRPVEKQVGSSNIFSGARDRNSDGSSRIMAQPENRCGAGGTVPLPVEAQLVTPLRQHNNVSNTVTNTVPSAHSRFVPKQPIISLQDPDKSNRNRRWLTNVPSFASSVSRLDSGQDLVQSQASRDMFSDVDDIDISSVLDGIDSESLFGDF